MAGKKGRGRPSFLLDKVTGANGELVPIADAMCDRIRIGVSLRGACEAYNIDQSSFFRAMAIGREDVGVGKRTMYSQFAQQIARARADCRAFYAKQIAVQSPQDWRAASWMLERQFHDEYGERKQVEVAGALAPQITIQLPDWAQVNFAVQPAKLSDGDSDTTQRQLSSGSEVTGGSASVRRSIIRDDSEDDVRQNR